MRKSCVLISQGLCPRGYRIMCQGETATLHGMTGCSSMGDVRTPKTFTPCHASLGTFATKERLKVLGAG